MLTRVRKTRADRSLWSRLVVGYEWHPLLYGAPTVASVRMLTHGGSVAPRLSTQGRDVLVLTVQLRSLIVRGLLLKVIDYDHRHRPLVHFQL